MSSLDLITITSRTAAILIVPEGAKYRLADPVAWQLKCDGMIVASGQAKTTSLFIEDLVPDTEYCLTTDIGELKFTTGECTGCIQASDFGVSSTALDNAAAFAKAIAAVPTGGTLVLVPGRYVTGPIFLKSQMTFYIPEGVTIVARDDRDNWPILPARGENDRVVSMWEGLPEASFAAPITAIDCNDLSITGRGIVDGSGAEGDWWSWPKEMRNGARRPRTLYLAHSNGVSLSGFTIRNSPSWTVHPFRCDDLTVSALFIQNPPDSPNTDGLNPEMCLNTTIKGLHFSVGDDCIAVKAGKRGPGQEDHLHPTRHLNIEHCLMERGHGAVVLGSEMSGDITDVQIRACEFVGTDRGLRIKTRRGRGGLVARIIMEQVSMEDVATPIALNAFYFCDADGKSDFVQSRKAAKVDESTPTIADINISNISVDNAHLCVAALLGLPERPISGVRISDIHTTFAPDAKAAVPLMALGVDPVRHGGIISQFADPITESNIKIHS